MPKKIKKDRGFTSPTWLFSKSAGLMLIFDNVPDVRFKEIVETSHMTDAWVHRCVTRFVSEGLITSERVGRGMVFNITEKGRIFTKHFRVIYTLLSGYEIVS